MQAFHNDPSVKEKYLSRVAAHAAADRLIQGTGWNGSKGCAVGCTLEAYDHSRYPIELGLPEWLARLEDSIFEGLPAEDAMTWPQRFLEAIPVGADVEPVRHKLAVLRLDRLISLQTSLLGKGVDDAVNGVLAAMYQVRRCHEAEANHEVCEITFDAAESAARSAAESAWRQEAKDLLSLLAGA